MSSEANTPGDHSENPYAPAIVEFDQTREFVDDYLPRLVDVLGYTWQDAQELSTVYLAQCVVFMVEAFDAPNARTAIRALAWEVSDHVVAVNYSTPIRGVSVPEHREDCPCGQDHHLEANALATFLDCSVRGEQGRAVQVLDALWLDARCAQEGELLRVGANLLVHVIGSMVFARYHRACTHD